MDEGAYPTTTILFLRLFDSAIVSCVVDGLVFVDEMGKRYMDVEEKEYGAVRFFKLFIRLSAREGDCGGRIGGRCRVGELYSVCE